LLDESIRLARQAGTGGERSFTLDRLEGLRAFYDELDAIAAMVLRLEPRRLARLLRRAGRLLGVRTP
jgi:hypothetical protein